MMSYFEVCRASYGAIPWSYLESLPAVKFHYLYRTAQIVNLRESIESIADNNAAFAGGKKRVEALRKRMESLTLEAPKTDTDKLAQVKAKFKRKAKAKKAAKKKKDLVIKLKDS